MMTTSPAVREPNVSPSAAAGPAPRAEIKYIYGIRGISSLYILFFHLNYIVLAAHRGVVDPLYARLTDWMRVGDFRVSAFFVISGYLLTLPTLKTADWKLREGVRGFMARRAERLLFPYYIAFGLSVLLYVAWRYAIGSPPGLRGTLAGIVTHLLLIHNLDARTSLLINDTLWNVALEFQCYVLFAFVLLPIMRRFGPLAQLAVAAVIGLGPHFLLHGFLDWTRPWFITLYAMGVTVCALSNQQHPELKQYERSVPWGAIWIVMSIASLIAIVTSGVDTPYGAGWLQNICLGAAVSAFLVYTRTGLRGPFAALGRPIVRFLELPFLCRLGRFSYSTYLIHYPILRLATGITALWVSSLWYLGALSFFVYAPITLLLAYAFHVHFELPWQTRRVLSAPRPTRTTRPAAQQVA